MDLSQRRTDLAEAVWRVVLREGLEGASVRAVAVEAGLSMGSLRHYFATQSELHRFAMRLVTARIRSRIEALPALPDAWQQAQQVLEELLPLDELRRSESEVWLAFSARALVDPALRALRDEGWDLLREVCALLVARLAPAGQDLERESARLHALVDGLLVHGVLRPGRMDPVEVRRVLARHLEDLAGPTTRTAHSD